MFASDNISNDYMLLLRSFTLLGLYLKRREVFVGAKIITENSIYSTFQTCFWFSEY